MSTMSVLISSQLIQLLKNEKYGFSVMIVQAGLILVTGAQT